MSNHHHLLVSPALTTKTIQEWSLEEPAQGRAGVYLALAQRQQERESRAAESPLVKWIQQGHKEPNAPEKDINILSFSL